MREATGGFEVKVQPQAGERIPDTSLGRSTLEKDFRDGKDYDTLRYHPGDTT